MGGHDQRSVVARILNLGSVCSLSQGSVCAWDQGSVSAMAGAHDLPAVALLAALRTTLYLALALRWPASGSLHFFLWKSPLVPGVIVFKTPILAGGFHPRAGAQSQGAVEKLRTGGLDSGSATQSGHLRTRICINL